MLDINIDNAAYQGELRSQWQLLLSLCLFLCPFVTPQSMFRAQCSQTHLCTCPKSGTYTGKLVHVPDSCAREFGMN